MGNFLALTRREMGAYFASAMAYVILTSLLVVFGYFFLSLLGWAIANEMPVRFEQSLSSFLFILTLFCPLITMRLIAEEKSQGTLETLMTVPVTETQFVLAKFFASLLFLHYLLLLPIGGYATLLGFHVSLDAGALFTSYLGVVLVAGTLFSIGLFVSSLCRSQITAGVVTFLIAAFLTVLGWVMGNPDKLGWAEKILRRLNLLGGAESFLNGVIDLRDAVYYLSMTTFFLYLTVQTVRSRRWR